MAVQLIPRALRPSLPYVSLTAAILLAFGTTIIWVLNLGTEITNSYGNRWTPLVLAADGVIFALVGWLIEMRKPGLAVARVALLIGFIATLSTAVVEFAAFDLLTTESDILGGGEFAAWLGNWMWVIHVGLIGTVLVMIFPNGPLPGRAWKWMLRFSVVGMGAAAVYFALAPGPLTSIRWVDNPFSIEADWIEWLSLGFFALASMVVAAASSMVIRYRAALGDERAQIRWFAAAATLVALMYVGQTLYSVVTNTLEGGTEVQRWFQTGATAAFGAVGLAIGIAVLRYKLFEIDRIISRTVSYALVVGLLGATYIGLVAGFTTVMAPDEPLVVAASTLAVAALFNPIRRRVQGMVDRRFNRSRHDMERRIERFVSSLRDQVDVDEIARGWADLVTDVMQPTTVVVWLRR